MDESGTQSTVAASEGLRGVLADDLERFLAEVAVRRDELEAQLRAAGARAAVARDALTAAVEADGRLGERLLAAHEDADRRTVAAKAEADIVLRQAEQEAATVLAAAHLEAIGARR